MTTLHTAHLTYLSNLQFAKITNITKGSDAKGYAIDKANKQTNKHQFNCPFPALPRWAGTRKAKPIWILLKQETVSGSGISWAIFKTAPRSRQITTPAPHH